MPFWRRVHVRMSNLFGGVVFLIVTLMAFSVYFLEVDNQVTALRSQLLTEVRALSHRIRPQAAQALSVKEDRAKPAYAELVDLFGSVTADEKRIVSIDVLRPTNRPHILAFAADYVAPGRSAPAEVGEEV